MADKEAQFEYKCRRCGKVSLNPCCNEDMAVGRLYIATLHLAKPEIRMFGVHDCKDGGKGVSDLQGYRVV